MLLAQPPRPKRSVPPRRESTAWYISDRLARSRPTMAVKGNRELRPGGLNRFSEGPAIGMRLYKESIGRAIPPKWKARAVTLRAAYVKSLWMRPAEDYDEIREGLVCWSAYDPASKVDLHSTGLRAEDKLVFVDPIRLGEAPLARMLANAHPGGIILTNANHERASAAFAKKLGVRIMASRDASEDTSIFQHIEDGEVFLGSLRCISLPGAAAGEVAIHSPEHGGILCVGDALINLPPECLRMLPAKYCENPKLLRVSLQKLLQFPFEIMTFAHGTPITSDARAALQKLLQ